MLSRARKLAPCAVVSPLLACLAFFGCLGLDLVAQAREAGSDQTQISAARQSACLARLHHEAAPADELSATEPEQPEQDVTLEARTSRLVAQVAPLERFARPSPRLSCAQGWEPQPIRSTVMAQGPP